jgi:hypothetical protein
MRVYDPPLLAGFYPTCLQPHHPAAEPSRRARLVSNPDEPPATPTAADATAAPADISTGGRRHLLQGPVPCRTNKAFPYGVLVPPVSWDWRNAGVITPVRNQLGVRPGNTRRFCCCCWHQCTCMNLGSACREHHCQPGTMIVIRKT